MVVKFCFCTSAGIADSGKITSLDHSGGGGITSPSPTKPEGSISVP
ncbi:MAG: hypothetical protein U0235_00905 [Polyangiaceae bacterium]